MTPDQLVPGMLYGHVNAGVWSSSRFGPSYIVIDANRIAYIQSATDPTLQMAWGPISKGTAQYCVPAIPIDQRLPDGF